MNDYEIMDLLNKMERAKSLINDKKDVDVLLDKVLKLQKFFERFASLDELIEHLRTMEKYFFVEKDMFTIQESAMYMGVSNSFVYRLSCNHEIPVYKPSGKLIYIAKEDIINWMKQNIQLSNGQIKDMAMDKLEELNKNRVLKRINK